MGYEETWRRFQTERRLEFGGHRDPSWSDGHSLSASFLIPVDAELLRERLRPLRESLDPFPFVSLHPDRFLHVTLLLLGFLVEEPGKEAEVSRDGLAALEAGARRALANVPPFTVRLANLNAFPGAAFVEAHDGGKLQELRSALSKGCGLREPSGPPHLTLAYFQTPDGERAPEELIEKIRRYRDWPVGNLRVDAVEMTLLDLRKEYPEPETLIRIPLMPTPGAVGNPATGRKSGAGPSG